MALLRRILLDSSAPPGWGRIALAARVAAGAVFLGFSVGKFVRHSAETAALDRYGLPFPDAFTYAVGGVELAGGAMLVLGLGTRLAALALACDMVGAITTAGRIEGGPVHLGLAPALLATMLLVLWAGPGTRSLDWCILGRTGDRRASPSLDDVAGPGPS
jgi:putative oxidoreductase